MKPSYFLLFASLSICLKSYGQVYTPINTFGYNLDAVAENTTAASTTGGAIDGSNYVMYSASYGALYSISNGLPNNGVIASGTQTYQLQPYTQNNMLYVPSGFIDSISFTTPASFAALSLLGFATEGTASINVTVRFTDNTTQMFTGQSYSDWFATGTSVYSGFDRVSRSTGVPANLTGDPKMFNLQLSISCANRLKNVQRIIVQNYGSNARACVMAVSGAALPVFNASASPVTCSGGTNGSAAITGTGGSLPYTYTWSTSPAQTTSLAIGLSVGVYSYGVQDFGGCIVSSTVAVTQSIVPEPALVVTSNVYTICSGSSFTLGTSGAQTYTWMNGSNSILYSPSSPTANVFSSFIYTVSGKTAANCLRTGSITIYVNPLPGAAFISVIPTLCNNSASIALSSFVAPQGGNFSGTGVSGGFFVPSNTGTFNILYVKTDLNNCSSSATAAVQVFSLAAPQVSLPAGACANGGNIQMTVNPTGGNFSGNGINFSGNISPSVAGIGLVTYSYQIISGPCVSSNTKSIFIFAAPSASIAAGKTFFCKNSPSYIYNGQPSGGTFSGPALTGSTFDPSKATVGNNNIIIYSYTDGNGCSDTASVRIIISNCVNLIEDRLETEVSVFPNPGTGMIFIKSKSLLGITVINEIGQKIKQSTLDEKNSFEFIVEALAPGIYFLIAENNSAVTVKKVIVTD